jgi:general secretion pathway protein B
MSYILDALRKADAERERDPARGIHAQPLAAASPHAAARRPYWAGVAVVAVLLLAGGAALWPREEPVAVAPAVTAPAPAPAAVVPEAPAPVPATAPPVVPVAAAVSPPPPPALPAPVPKPVAKAAPAPLPSSVAPAAPAATAPGTPPVAAAAPAPDRVFALAELPADIQRDLPKLAISGGVHSENAAQRMLIVGGQVMGEGTEVAPGVVLEQIRARTAVLRFRGYRYSVGF